MSFYSEFAYLYDQVFPFREEVYSFLLAHAGRAGGAVLDAGCGQGHYCGKFLRDGFRVTGVDLDRKMIDTAAAAYPQVEFQRIDIAKMAFPPFNFQLIYSIGNVVSHLLPQSLATFLGSVFATLETGGCWIFQVVNWDYLLTQKDYIFPVKTLSSGSVVFHRRYHCISEQRVTFEVQITSGGKTVFSEQTTLYPFTSDAFLSIHKRAGFALESIYSGFKTSEFRKDQDSALVMVFKKQ